MGELPESRSRTRVIPAAVEALAAVGASTLVVALLDTVAPTTGLGVIYLLAVLFVAMRRGEVAALATAVLSVLSLNFFFIEPRHRLTISESENVVALIVFLITALAVGRLATAARQRAREADERARIATAREREARMLAAATSSLLDGGGTEGQAHRIERGVGSAAGARVGLSQAPSPHAGEAAVRLPTSSRPAWLYHLKESGWTREDLERVGTALAQLVDLAVEREQLGEQAAEAEASRRAEAAKTAVLHAISHDLRSPLTAITTAADGLSGSDVSRDDREELVSVVRAEAARLSRLVDDLLDLSRIEANAVNPIPDWCDLRDVVVSAATQVQARHGDQQIEFAVPADLPLVRADPAQLERVFTNLIENAIRFSPLGAPVRVFASAGGSRVTVRVANQGGAIPRSERMRIFEPFVRGREAGQGSGLGLAICRGFVEANGGRIVLQTGTGDETSFAVSFPLVPQPALA